MYAFSGFEVLGVPSGEIDDPARTIPFALLAGLAVVAMIYVGVQVVAIGTLPGLASPRDHSPMRQRRCSVAQGRR